MAALTDAYERAVASSHRISDVDAALVESGRQIAHRVDAAVAAGDDQATTKALYLLPHLINVLRELLATPASRLAAEKAADPSAGEGKLARLRAVQAKRQPKTRSA